MKPEQIKQEIAVKGFSISLIAESLGVGVATVSAVVNGHSTSLRTASFIAKVIGLEIIKVFPAVPQYTRQPKMSKKNRQLKLQQLNDLLDDDIER